MLLFCRKVIGKRLRILLCLALRFHRVGARAAGHAVDAELPPLKGGFGILTHLGLLHAEATAKGGGGKLSGGDDGMALGHVAEHCLDIGFLDDVEVLVRGGILGPDDSGGRVVHCNAFLLEKGFYLWLVKTLFPLQDEMVLVVEKEEAHDAPHVVLEVRVIEWHAPSVLGGREGAQHQELRSVGNEWNKGMALYLTISCLMTLSLKVLHTLLKGIIVDKMLDSAVKIRKKSDLFG